MTENTNTAFEPGELATLHRGRADMYMLLARLYRVEADMDLLERMRVAGLAQSGSQGWSQVAAYLGQDHDDVVTELAVDYVRAFIGTGVDGRNAAYPFESVYTDEKRLLMGTARDEVLALYLSEGLGRTDSWTVGEDHIALELEFMGTLAARAAEAAEKGDVQEADRLAAVQKAFMDDHLGVWVPAFIANALQFARTDFYRGIARATGDFLSADAEMLAELA